MVDLKDEVDGSVLAVHLDPALGDGIVDPVVDVKGLLDRILHPAAVDVALVGDDDGGRHHRNGSADHFLVVSDGTQDRRDFDGIHPHLIENSKGDIGPADGVIDAVDHVTDVVQVARDLAQLDFAGRSPDVFHHIAGDAADDSDVALAVLGVAHRLQHFVGPVDQGLDLRVFPDVV